MGGTRWIALAALLALAGCDLGGREEAAATRPTTLEVTTTDDAQDVPPPERFRVKPGTFRATLRWDPSPDGPPLDAYDVYRNGRLVTSVRGHETSYVDGDVQPGRKYRWRLVARAGEGSAPAVRTSARMKVPPLAAARIEGDFTLQLERVSHSGYSRLGGLDSLGWTFSPKCSAGACRRVGWRDLHERKMRGVLVRDGARYTGTYTGYFFTACRGTNMSSYVEIELEVRRAKVVNGAWHATRLHGTVTNSESSQLGCVASRMTQSVRARLYPSSLPPSV